MQQPPAYTANQQQMIAQQPQQVVAVQHGNAAVMSRNQTQLGNWKSLKGTGITQIVLGSLSVVIGIVSCVIRTYLFFIGHAIWCGLLFYAVAGILGLIAGQKQNQCISIAYMIMSIFACLAACTVMGFSATAIIIDQRYCGFYGSYSYNCDGGGRVAVDVMLLILALVEFVVSIVGASMTCSAVCSTTPTQTVIHYQAQPQMVVAAQPQGAVTYYTPPGQQQFATYPAQQAVAPQGMYYPQGQVMTQGTPQGTPQAPPPENQYQALAK